MQNNYAPGIYIFGKKIGAGEDIPIGANFQKIVGSVAGVADVVGSVASVATESTKTTFNIIGYIKENWKLFSIGAVALVVLLKD